MELEYRKNQILDWITVLRDSKPEALKKEEKIFEPGITRDHQSYTSLRNKANEL